MSKTNANPFWSLKASFKNRSEPTTATSYRSVAGDLANMSFQQPTRRVPSIAKSIDSVLDTPPASPPVRPLAKLRPSWIGPAPAERPTTPGVSDMKQTVTVQYSSPGLQPPVYILTSLSDPQWDPIEMHQETNSDGGYVFSKVFRVEEGEYQYKFRLGAGDWWVCDESIPTVDDGYGNKNNLLVVKSDAPQQTKQPEPAPKAENAVVVGPQGVSKTPEIVPLPNPSMHPQSGLKAANGELSAPAPVLKHATFMPQKGSEAEQTPDKEESNPLELDEEEPDDSRAQLFMKHENLASKAESKNDSAFDDRESSSSYSDSEDEAAQPISPLLRHESFASSSVRHNQSSLFHHESVSVNTISSHTPVRLITPTKAYQKPGNDSPIPMEASPEDHSLERFPTDIAGIMEKIHHVQRRLPEDQMVHHYDLGSPDSTAVSDSSVSVPSLPSVREDDEETLEKIREMEEEEVEKEEASGEELDPLKTGPPSEPEDADFEPKVVVYQEKVAIEEKIIIEIVEQRRSLIAELLDKVGGKGNALYVHSAPAHFVVTNANFEQGCCGWTPRYCSRHMHDAVFVMGREMTC